MITTDSVSYDKKEWKKDEKRYYLPKEKPECVDIPPMTFFVLEGRGNPNDAFFSEYIEALYAASYGLRMSYKSKKVPEGYFEYTVYPLEGVWDLSEAGKAQLGDEKDKADEGVSIAHLKDEFIFKLMIRQPEFVTEAWTRENLPLIAKKKGNPLIDKIRLVTFIEGKCVQMLHCGPYDSEPESFVSMEAFCRDQGLKRIEKSHREIYLSDARKVPAEKLKTVLRIRVE